MNNFNWKFFYNLRAITYFLLIVGIAITLLETKLAINKIEIQSQADIALMAKDTENSVQKSIANNDSPEKLVKMGLSLNKAGYIELAIIALKKACELDPRWRDSQWALTLAYANWYNSLSGPATPSQLEEANKRKSLTKEGVEATLDIDPLYEPALELAKQLQ